MTNEIAKEEDVSHINSRILVNTVTGCRQSAIACPQIKPPTTPTRLGCLILLLALGSPAAWADLSVSFNCYNPSQAWTTQTSAAPAPASLSLPFSCNSPGVGTVSGTGVAGYLSSGGSGAAITYSGSGNFNAQEFSYDTLLIGGLAPGTPLALTFNGVINGSYTESVSAGADLQNNLTEQLAITSPAGLTSLFDIGQALDLCVPDGCPAGESQNGTLTVPLISTTFDTTVGAALTLSAAFYQQILSGNGSVTDNFLDPFSITNIQVTDPNTGQLLSGVTITGSSGLPYTVNGVPEPSSLMLTFAALALAPIIARKRVS
jgi:hypothetical protein